MWLGRARSGASARAGLPPPTAFLCRGAGAPARVCACVPAWGACRALAALGPPTIYSTKPYLGWHTGAAWGEGARPGACAKEVLPQPQDSLCSHAVAAGSVLGRAGAGAAGGTRWAGRAQEGTFFPRVPTGPGARQLWAPPRRPPPLPQSSPGQGVAQVEQEGELEEGSRAGGGGMCTGDTCGFPATSLQAGREKCVVADFEAQPGVLQSSCGLTPARGTSRPPARPPQLTRPAVWKWAAQPLPA